MVRVSGAGWLAVGKEVTYPMIRSKMNSSSSVVFRIDLKALYVVSHFPGTDYDRLRFRPVSHLHVWSQVAWQVHVPYDAVWSITPLLLGRLNIPMTSHISYRL